MAGIYGVSQVNEITPNLYLTSVYGATKENILKKGITLLVNAAQELPKQEIIGVESIKLFLDDTPYANIHVYFDRIADKIAEHINRGGRIMVHCVLGVSRSTSLILAYLMKYRNMSLKNSFDLVSSRRPCVRPNPGFWRQLIDYEKSLNNMKTYSSSTSSQNTSNLINQKQTAIPIQIVSSYSSSNPSTSLSSTYMKHQHQPAAYGSSAANTSSSYVASSSSNSYNNASTTIPVQHEYRPLSSNRYATGASQNYSKASSYKTHEDNYNSNAYTSVASSMAPSSSTHYTLPGQHRTSVIVNTDDSYAKKSSPFSTTYRTSYGRY